MSQIIIKNTTMLPEIGDSVITDLNEKSIIPDPMFRRKLTRSSKIAICLTHMLTGGAKMPMVFGTAYGELKPTCKILNNIHSGKKVMPLDFQNSVHNTPMSYNSIFYHNTASLDTVSCGEKTAYQTLKCAYIKLKTDPAIDQILAVCVDICHTGANELFNGMSPIEVESGVAILLERIDRSVDKELVIANEIIKIDGNDILQKKGLMASTEFMQHVAVAAGDEPVGLVYR